MTPQEFILNKLHQLHPPATGGISDPPPIEQKIFKLLMSKKFRKYSAPPELQQHIQTAIHLNVEKQQPIPITFLQGAYKLWRLPAAPEADWAELFAAMYFSRWVRDICGIYEPGVWFDFFVDDLIVPKINNLTLEEVRAYIRSFQQVLDFLKLYQPANLKMTITTVGDQFESPQAFDESLTKNVEKLRQTKPVFTEEQLQAVELNARPSQEQLTDPHWREKLRLIHDAYSATKRESGYHYRPDKIVAFTQSFGGKFLAVGTTKTSIAKHWVGTGALVKVGDTYQEYIFSPSQIASKKLVTEKTNVPGLEGKNFRSILVVTE